MKVSITLLAVCTGVFAFSPWEAVGPEGIGNGLSSITQSYEDPSTLYTVGACIPQGNYIHASLNLGGDWVLISSPSGSSQPPGSIMSVTPDGTMLFARVNQDQIARSIDEGLTWTWVSFSSDYSTVRDIVTVPDHAGSAWAAGIGKSTSGPYRAFFWKTDDSGLSWSSDDLITTASEAYRIAVCADDPDNIYVAGQMNTSPRVPLIMRSTDGGTSWMDVTPQGSLAEDSIGLAVAVSPIDPLLVLFSTRKNIYRSLDGGQTWIVVSGKDWMYDIEFSPADPSLAVAGGNGTILRSSNAGLSWSSVLIGGPGETIREVFPSRVDQNMVFACTSEGFRYSTDAGASWALDNDGIMLVATDAVAASSDPSPRLYMVINGVFSYSDDLGSTWTAAITPGGMNTYGLQILVDPFDRENLVCLDYNGDLFHSTDGGFVWTVDDSTFDGGGDLASDPLHPGVMYAGGYREVGGQDWMCLGTSEDGGATWNYQDMGDSSARLFTIAVDPNHPDTVYIAGSYRNTIGPMLLRTLDGGVTWDSVQTSLQYSGIYDIAVSPEDPDVLLLCNYNGLFRSDDFGITWAAVLPCAYAEYVFFDPFTPQRVWSYQHIYSFLGISVSNDAGLTWSQWNEGLVTRYQVNSLALVSDQWLYASTGCAAFRLETYDVGLSGETPCDPLYSGITSVSPNPIRSAASICFTVTETEPLEFTVYDVSGRAVSSFTELPEHPGANIVFWDPRTETGHPLATGVYFIRMRSTSGASTARVILLR